jgi:hypothetical protein
MRVVRIEIAVCGTMCYKENSSRKRLHFSLPMVFSFFKKQAPVEQEARDANARMLAKTGRASRKQMKRMEKQEEEIRQAELARDQAQQAREARENARKAAADSYLDAISA